MKAMTDDELNDLIARNAELRARIEGAVREISANAAQLHALAFPTPASEQN
jgi:hypothetical protein